MKFTDEQIIEAYGEENADADAAASLGMTRQGFGYRRRKLGLAPRGTPGRPKANAAPAMLPASRVEPDVREGEGVYILCCAQGGVSVNERLWRNIEAYASHRCAEILVAKAVYDTREQRNVKDSDDGFDPHRWDECVLPFIEERPVRLAPTLEFTANMNILPTAVAPLSGVVAPPLISSVVPHQKRQMVSLPTMRGRPVFRYTTGSITTPRHIQRKAGQLAEFHHGAGFVVAEVERDGKWWVRFVAASDEGEFQDLGTLVTGDGEVLEDQPVDHIVCGDIHMGQRDEDVYNATFGKDAGDMVETLRPEVVVLHDLFDGGSVNRHENWLTRYTRQVGGMTVGATVRGEIGHLFDELRKLELQHPGLEFVVPGANHHAWLDRWLDTADYRQQGEDAVPFLELEAARLRAAEEGRRFVALAEALWQAAARRQEQPLESVHFMKRGESIKRCGIELGEHGDMGPNGVRGSAQGMARLADKVTIGHTHSAEVKEGVYVAGTTSKLDMGYNAGGGSSWSHSHVVAYKSGHRTVVTFWDDQWRAE